MIELHPIGKIHSPFSSHKDAPRQGRGCEVSCTVEIFEQFAPGLGSMEEIEYIWILYWMDKADRTALFSRRPDWQEAKPVFTIRSPSRPNPVALSIGKIERIEGNRIVVCGIEALDGSPVIDIKPYIPALDCIKGV